MEAIVLAGGFGTRLQTVVPGLPKPMAPIAGRPFLEILLSMLSRKGFNRVVLSLGHKAQMIVSHFGNEFANMELIYEIEATPLGTGGAIRAALTRCTADHVFIYNGDTYIDVNVNALEALWAKEGRPIVVLREVSDTARFGRVELTDGRITAFVEKGISLPGFINAGCYVLPVHALREFPADTFFSLEDEYLAKKFNDIYFRGFVTDGRFIDIGVPEDYARAQTELANL